MLLTLIIKHFNQLLQGWAHIAQLMLIDANAVAHIRLKSVRRAAAIYTLMQCVRLFQLLVAAAIYILLLTTLCQLALTM